MKVRTFTSSINAYTLKVGAKRLGFSLSTTEAKSTFPIAYENDVGQVAPEWICFTEEASLARALRGELGGNFLPKKFPLELLDDKWAMANWMASNENLPQGLDQWEIDNKANARFPCLLKAKNSWFGNKKLPRGWVCATRHELDQSIENLVLLDLPAENFFIQEWLGDQDCRVISVCGFHDSQNNERNLFAIVERIAAHSTGLSCSAAIATTEDLWDVRGKAIDILNELEFVGPFEIEFLIVKGRVVVLELNPRFWMQHAIFLVNGNGLMKRYFGLDNKEDQTTKTISNIVWIDGLHLMQSLASLQWTFVLKMFLAARSTNQNVLIWPSLSMSGLAWVRIIWNGRRKLIKKAILLIGRIGKSRA